VRFDEVILQDQEDELRVRFHQQLTILSGLGADERQTLGNGILAALTGGEETTTLHCVDGTGRPVIISGSGGQIRAEHEDGSPAALPLGSIAPDAKALRRLMLVSADDLGAVVRRSREDESPELREARDMLEELTYELKSAQGQELAVAELQSRLEGLERDLRAAQDGVARREYAKVLAQLERVRAEAAALQSGTAGIEADRHLLANADDARALAAQWNKAAARAAGLRESLSGGPRLDREDQQRLVNVPSAPPDGLDALVAALGSAAREREALDQRLQDLAVSTLPAPSVPIVAEVGLLDQASLWHAANRLTAANAAMQQVQVSLGGLEVDEMGPPPAVIEDIEVAHRELEEAEQAVEAAWMPGVAGTSVGVVAALLALTASPILAVVGLGGAAVAAVAGIAKPRARRAAARLAEQRALERADATSYLGFHIRRVEASVDPKLRELVETTTVDQRGALAAWIELVGPDVDVDEVQSLATEIAAYHDAVQNLGDTAVELEDLRVQLTDRAEPALTAARQAVLDVCAPYLIDEEALDDDRMVIPAVLRQVERGAQARAESEVQAAEIDEQRTAARLDELLLQLGFDAGELAARVGALEWAVTRADEREQARSRARSRAEIDAELAELQDTAARLRQPEWAAVTAAEAAAPDIAEIEARRDEVVQELARVRAEVDIDRLADRHAAVERRVSALEARDREAGGSDPSAIADIHQHLVARLTVAAQAAPHGDPVPVVLDEVLARVPADRTWDLLDLLLRLAEHQQLIYLTDDAFVAAWARQRAIDGTITLLEPAPESV
jgi:hypothetical protein